jgi:hypothetical protein
MNPCPAALLLRSTTLAPQGSRICTPFGPFTTRDESPQEPISSRCYANLLWSGVESYNPGLAKWDAERIL